MILFDYHPAFKGCDELYQLLNFHKPLNR